MEATQHAPGSPDLRLAAVNGRRLDGVEGANGEERIPHTLTEAAAEDELIASLADLRERIPEDGDLRYEITMLLARFEQRRARRA
jgi:hypothetical protein